VFFWNCILTTIWKVSNSFFFGGVCSIFIKIVEMKPVEWNTNARMNHQFNGWWLKLANQMEWFLWIYYNPKKFMSMDEINLDKWGESHLLHEFHVYIMKLKLRLGAKLNNQTRGNDVSSWFDETITRSFMLFQNEMNSCTEYRLEFFFIHKYSFWLLTSIMIHLHAMNEHHKMSSMNF
jgi:hypothetical protein